MQAPLDILIVGGGVNGTFLARHAASLGYSVALLEKDDFGAGVTSRSTRLIHGGLRYLESGQFRVVKESLHDRRLWLDEFPGQTRPMQFLIPVYKGDTRPAWYLNIGLFMYGYLSRDPELDDYQRLSAADLKALEPGLDQANLKAGFLYFDGQVAHTERTCLELALQAEQLGARVENHHGVADLLIEKGRVIGARTTRGEEIRASVTVNAGGAWVDQVRSMAEGVPDAKLLSRLNGAHIFLERFENAPDHAVYHEARSDGRPFFIVPWRGLLMIGTTETPYDGDPDRVLALEKEIDYLVQESNHLFPEAGITRDSVLYSYAGSRPLLHAKTKNFNSASRDHAVYDHEAEENLPGLLSMVGGKLTTAPSFAAHALEVAAKKLGRPDPGPSPRLTKGVAPEDSRLGEIYGPRTAELQRWIGEDGRRLAPALDGSETTVGEILFGVEHEKATTLGDVMIRRTGLTFQPGYQPDWPRNVAEIISEKLQWTESDVERQLADYRDELDRTLIGR